MKRSFPWLPLVLALLLLPLTGCELAGDILEAGFWAGVLVGGLLVGALWWVFGRLFRRR